MPRRLTRVRPLLGLVPLLALGCADSADSGSSGLIPGPATILAGTWVGTFTSDDGTHSGEISFDLEQDAEFITGTTTFTTLVGDPDCWNDGDLSMQVAGISASGTLLNWTRPGLQVQLTGTLDVAGNLMDGSYEAIVLPGGTSCIGEVGEIAAGRE